MMSRARLPFVVLMIAILAFATGCGGNGTAGGDRPTIAVTHPILGSVVEDLVGGVADVRVVMPAGVDPHDFQPSAKDIALLRDADLVVANGLGLETGLDDALRQAEDDGHRVFTASDHIAVLRVDGAQDPHFWTDPTQMKAVTAALAGALRNQLGLDLSAPAAATDRRLAALDADIERALSAVPPTRRRMVTGHESMGYFARRYGFTLVGAVVPGLSTQARVSASELADLKATIAREGVGVVFVEAGTPRQVADAIADETGVRVVEIPAHTLPDDGSYDTLMRDTARLIAGALTAGR